MVSTSLLSRSLDVEHHAGSALSQPSTLSHSTTGGREASLLRGENSLNLSWNDRWQSITIEGYTLRLSPTQYRICQAFLARATPSTISAKLVVVSYLTLTQLQEETQLFSRVLLSKHISLLNARLECHDLRIELFRSGYILVAW